MDIFRTNSGYLLSFLTLFVFSLNYAQASSFVRHYDLEVHILEVKTLAANCL